MDGLFDPREDQAFRDAVYRVNKTIKQLFDDEDYSKPFRIVGASGEIRKIAYPNDRWTQNPER
jgi:hypothetical protein